METLTFKGVTNNTSVGKHIETYPKSQPKWQGKIHSLVWHHSVFSDENQISESLLFHAL